MNIPRPANLPELHFDSWDRLSSHCSASGTELAAHLGWGYEGLVYSTISKSAIKAFRHKELYENERSVYFRLRDHHVKAAHNFAVPRLIAWNDEFFVIAMTIVSPPFILDFAGAYLDKNRRLTRRKCRNGKSRKLSSSRTAGRSSAQPCRSSKATESILNDIKPGNVTFSGDDK